MGAAGRLATGAAAIGLCAAAAAVAPVPAPPPTPGTPVPVAARSTTGGLAVAVPTPVGGARAASRWGRSATLTVTKVADRSATVIVGRSVQGRAIVAFHRWYPGRTTTRLLVIGQMHGDEDSGKRVVARLRTAALPTDLDLWLVPTINPDGDVRDTRDNAHRVDLNRNFPTRWRLLGRGTRYYSGPRPASEPETRAVRSFIARLLPRTIVSFHLPLNGVDAYDAKDPGFVRALAAATGYPVRRFSCSSGCHGTLTQWADSSTPAAAVTFELGPTTSEARIARVASAVLRLAAAR